MDVRVLRKTHIVFLRFFRNFRCNRVEIMQNKYVYHVKVDYFRSQNEGPSPFWLSTSRGISITKIIVEIP